MANYAWGWIELTGTDENLDKFVSIFNAAPEREPGGKSLLWHFLPTPAELLTIRVGWTGILPEAPDKGFYQVWREVPNGKLTQYGTPQHTLEAISADEFQRLTDLYGAARWTDWQKQNWGIEKGERLWLVGDEQRREWGRIYRHVTLKIESEWRMPFRGLIRLFREGFLPPLNFSLFWYVEGNFGAGEFTVNHDEWDRILEDGTLPDDEGEE